MFDNFKSHREFVSQVFQRVASKYDVMNDLMSFGIHRHWKRTFVDRLTIKPNSVYCDIAAGTGDITYKLYQRLQQRGLGANIIAVEPNPAMLAAGQAKLIDKGVLTGVTWVEASAEALPFDDHSIDGITIAFGQRNVSDMGASLNEYYRVLKPGGQFLCLEFSRVQHHLLDKVYQLYSQHIIPKMGHVVADDAAAYEYLVNSIRQFPDQETFKQAIESAGFTGCNYTNLTHGIVAIHEGWKL